MPKKSIIVGLGGTGDWVLTILKSRLYAAYGEEVVKRDVQFLLVDTIHSDTRESAFQSDAKAYAVRSSQQQHEESVAHIGDIRIEYNEYLPLTGEIINTAESIRKNSDPVTQHLDWFQADYYLRTLPAAAMNITDGAGQWRQFGRLALLLNAEKREFQSRIQKIIRNANLGHGDSIMIYIVCSLAGGTGAGIFLDAAALIRHVIENTPGTQGWIVGFLVLPDAFQSVLGANTMHTTIPRSFAAFRELCRFQTVAGGEVPFPIQFSIKEQVNIRRKLYDTVFLLSATTENFDLSVAPPWSGISPSIADGLEAFTDSKTGGGILEDLVNASAQMANQVQMNETLPAQFHSMGSHKIVIPARQYATIFANQFVVDFLDTVFPYNTDSGLPVLIDAGLKPTEYIDYTLDFLKKGPPLFTQIVDMLPGRDDHLKLQSFARGDLKDYRSLIQPKPMPPGMKFDSIITEEPISNISTGREGGDSAEDAAKRIETECQKRLEHFWERFNGLMAEIIAHFNKDCGIYLKTHIDGILNKQIPQFSVYPVGSAMKVLEQVITQCDQILAEVLYVTQVNIEKADPMNKVSELERVIAQARGSMQDTKGCNGYFSRGRAWDAQKYYMEMNNRLVLRKKIETIFKTYRKIVESMKTQASDLKEQIRAWADQSVLDDQLSARKEALQDIAEVETLLKQGGRTFTTSYGLNAYVQGESIDVTMKGYREKLYQRFVQPVVKEWKGNQRWEISSNGNAAVSEKTLPIKIKIDVPGGQTLELDGETGRSLHQKLRDLIRKQIEPKVTDLSIFDYFVEEKIKPEEIVSFFRSRSGPLISNLQSAKKGDIKRQIHLLVKEPREPQEVTFLENLRNEVSKVFDNVILAEGKNMDFDNPYTLTVMHIVQNIQGPQLALMDEYEQTYNTELLETDIHLLNHVFCAEQEAASIEKQHNLSQSNVGQLIRIDPRVTRLLDKPDRLRIFCKMLALGQIRMEPTPEDATHRVWMLLPFNEDDPKGLQTVWLTAPKSGGDNRSLTSIINAIEQFCFMGKSARHSKGIPINYMQVEKALRRRVNELITDGSNYSELIETYEDFIHNKLEKIVEKYCTKIHTPEEGESLKLVFQHYLTTAVEDLTIHSEL